MKSKWEKMREELLQISRDHGDLLHPVHVVAAAKSPKSALHSSFEWDDKKAAHAHRLEQARQIIRVCLPATDANGDGMVSLPCKRIAGGGYVPVSVVIHDSVLREDMMSDARKTMLHFKARFSSLAELAGVFAAMDEVLAEDKLNAAQ